MTSPHHDDEVNAPATNEQITDLPAPATEAEEVRGGVSEIVVTKSTDSASPKL